MKLRTLVFLPILTLLSITLIVETQAEDRIPRIDPQDLNRLLTEIKPRGGESRWREIHWLTDVSEARQRAVAENRPLVIFTAADGSPLGRT